MSAGILRDQRRSRYLFDATARWGLERNTFNAITGQLATLTRATPGNSLDSAGRMQLHSHSQPRFHAVDFDNDGMRETPLFLTEGQRTNLVVQSDAISAATGWTLGGTATAVANVGTYAGRSFSRVGGFSAGTITRAVTFTGNGVKADSRLVKFDGTTATYVYFVLDTTASAQRLNVTVTFNALGVVTSAVAVVGTVLLVEALADGVYRIHAQTTAITAANSHLAYAMGGGTATSMLVSGIQPEDATFPSSLLPTTSATLTRNQDLLSFPLGILPRVLTVYVDAMWYVAADAGTNFTAFAIGSGAPFLVGRLDGTTLEAVTLHDNGTGNVNAQTSNAGSYGHRGESRHVLQADGSVFTGLSVDGGTEVVTAASGPKTFAAAWANAVLYIGNQNGAQPGYFGFRAVRIAAGIQNLAFMREG
jgi:hypothetical protein